MCFCKGKKIIILYKKFSRKEEPSKTFKGINQFVYLFLTLVEINFFKLIFIKIIKIRYLPNNEHTFLKIC